MLELKNISKKYKSFEIRNINLVLDDGGYLVVLGRSGAGKTLLLEMITGLVRPDSGKIISGGTDITCCPVNERRIGMVFQNNLLFPHMTVRKNISYALESSGRFSKREITDTVNKISETFGISRLLNLYPGTISAGEAQRTALARTLVARPEYLLLDEPLSTLDPHTRGEIRDILKTILSGINGIFDSVKGIIHVTHDYEEAISLASGIAVINGGAIEQTGSPDEIFHHPKSEFIAGFVGIRNFYHGESVREGGGDICFRTMAKGKPGYVRFVIPDNSEPGAGFIIIRSEDITLSNARLESSARNVYSGCVVGIEKTRFGIEVTLDIGVEISAMITRESMEALSIVPGKQMYASFKASSVKFVK